MAVQESEFLPPPTQLDILYGFTDLIIVGMITKVFILRVTRLCCSEGRKANEDWEKVCTYNRQVRCSSLCTSPFGIFCSLVGVDFCPSCVVLEES